jgi:RIO-like serine/threonine protein kinase
VGRQQELSEFDLRVLLAVEATHGEESEIAEEVIGRSSGKATSSDVTRALTMLRTRQKYVERVGEDGYRLTAKGRRAAGEAAERLRRLATYAASVLR